MFFLKQFVSSFLMPFPIFLFLLGAGIYFWQRGNMKRAKQFGLFALAWILLLSYAPFSSSLLASLENTHTKIKLDDTDHPHYIHVLGCGHTTNPDLPLSSEISLVSLARITEGVSLYKRYPNMKLIFSGFGGDDPISNARKNSQLAIILGVNPKDIILLESPRDTQEEAMASKQVVGDQPIILVTSASHMTRALALFEKNGVRVIPAPTDFQIKTTYQKYLQFPSSAGLQYSETVFHEYLGLLWGKLRGAL